MTAPTERTFLATDGDAALLSPMPAAAAYFPLSPAPALRAYVERIHLGHEVVPADAPFEERVLPDGAVHLNFNFGNIPSVVGDGPAPPRPGGAMEAMGPASAPTVIRMAGHIEGVGVRLRPGGVAALLGVPASELAGRIVSLEALWGPTAGETLERMAETPHGVRRAALLERLLLQRLGGAPAAHAGAAEAVRRIGEAGGRITVRDLAAALGVGERRLEQIFHQHVGLTPKAACRLARFHASVRLLCREPMRRWSEIAHRCGFADQAHLVHEFRAFAGLTPGDLRARLGFGFPQDAPPVSY